MKSLLHGVLTVLVVVVASLCVLVQADHISTAIDVVTGQTAAASR
jgi:hypothetical protein